MAERWEHIPPDLLAHQIRGAAACTGVEALDAHARERRLAARPRARHLPAADRLGHRRPHPALAARGGALRRAAFPQADWVELDGVGHGAQLDVPLLAAQLILGFTAP